MTEDHRPEDRKQFDAIVGITQHHIDLYNRGYEFHQTYWPDGGPDTPVAEAMKHAEFSIIDMSPDAEAYWQGYEQAVREREAKGFEGAQPATAEDMQWAFAEILRFLKGDQK